MNRKIIQIATDGNDTLALCNERRKLIAKTSGGPFEFEYLTDEIPF